MYIKERKVKGRKISPPVYPEAKYDSFNSESFGWSDGCCLDPLGWGKVHETQISGGMLRDLSCRGWGVATLWIMHSSLVEGPRNYSGTLWGGGLWWFMAPLRHDRWLSHHLIWAS